MQVEFLEDHAQYKKGQKVEFLSSFWSTYYEKKGVAKPVFDLKSKSKSKSKKSKKKGAENESISKND